MKFRYLALGLFLYIFGAYAAPAQAGERRRCPANFRQAHIGDCWIQSPILGSFDWLYAHRRGWAVQESCIKRYPTIVEDLERAWERMNPASREPQGCMGTYNPALGAQWVAALWAKDVAIACPATPRFKACGTTSPYKYRPPPGQPGFPQDISIIWLNDTERCRFDHSENDAAMLFHETLHAVDFGSLSVQEHNQSYNMEQFKFIKDDVYAATMLCFMGTKPQFRSQVNYLQCQHIVKRDRSDADASICDPKRGFNSEFSNAPQHMYVH